MDEPADGAGALFPRFVCRVSGAPADTVDNLRAERTRELAGELAAVEARVARRREEDVSQVLFDAIGAAGDKPRRNRLIALKRELYNGRPPTAARVDEAAAALDTATAGQLRAYAADLERVRDLGAAIATVYDEETAALRRRFRELVRDGDFRKGLIVSSRALYANQGRYDAAAERGELGGPTKRPNAGCCGTTAAWPPRLRRSPRSAPSSPARSFPRATGPNRAASPLRATRGSSAVSFESTSSSTAFSSIT